MKKRGLRVMAWVMLLTMIVSLSGVQTRAYASEFPEDEIFRITAEELTNGKVLLLTAENADKNGTVVAEDGIWERVIVRRADEVKEVYLNGLETELLVIEGGMDCEIRLDGCNVAELVVTAPQTGGISFAKLYERRDAGEDISGLISGVFRYYNVMMETKDLRPEIITGEKTGVQKL